MANFEEAYQSLDKAKMKEQELKVQKERLEEIHDRVRKYCLNYSYMTFCSINEQIQALKVDIGDQALNIFLEFLSVAVGIGIVALISISCLDSIGLGALSIAGPVYFAVHSGKHFLDALTFNNRIKTLKGIEKDLSYDPNFNDQPLQNILVLLRNKEVRLRDELDTIGDSIMEYEHALSEANRTLAEEVFASSGIEASIALKSSLKVLAKRYEQK